MELGNLFVPRRQLLHNLKAVITRQFRIDPLHHLNQRIFEIGILELKQLLKLLRSPIKVPRLDLLNSGDPMRRETFMIKL